MKQIYIDLMANGPIDYRLIKQDKRIAIMLPDRSLDIMKVLDVVAVEDELIAVAKVCPGQASFALDPQGIVRLNDLISTMPLTPENEYAVRHGCCVEYPGWGHLDDERRAIGYKDKSHWRAISSESRIHLVRKDQMRVMMGYISKHPL